MTYRDAQHLIPHDPPDDGAQDETPESCAHCGEPLIDGDCANCRENWNDLVEGGACDREKSDGSNACSPRDPDPCALCAERRRRGIR